MDGEGRGAPQTISGAYDRIAAHEALCVERHTNIWRALRQLQGIIAAAGALSAALLGWSLKVNYDNLSTQSASVARLEAAISDRAPPLTRTTP